VLLHATVDTFPVKVYSDVLWCLQVGPVPHGPTGQIKSNIG
jgi:hypothetical protein